jgi:hypothetical protein
MVPRAGRRWEGKVSFTVISQLCDAFFLTKTTCLVDYSRGVDVEEVAGRVQIGAQLLRDAETRVAEAVGAAGPGQPEPVLLESIQSLPRQNGDGTLLAVVPIPGTGTSMAIVGYPVTVPGTAPPSVLPGTAGIVDGRAGLLLDHDQRRVWVNGAARLPVGAPVDGVQPCRPGAAGLAARLHRGQPHGRRPRQPPAPQARPRLRQVPRHRVPRRLPVPPLSRPLTPRPTPSAPPRRPHPVGPTPHGCGSHVAVATWLPHPFGDDGSRPVITARNQ